MANEKYEIEEVVFKKCPICKEGEVQTLKFTKFLGVIVSHKTICSKCHAKFDEYEEREGERVFSLDLSESNQKNRYEGQPLKISEWNRGISDLDFCVQNNTLPKTNVIGLNIVLQSGEQAHWYSASKLMQERAVRHTYGGATRIMKGVYIGARRGESHGELRVIDNGSLLLTNKRLIFNGGFRNTEYKLNKIVSIEEYKDAVEVGASNRQKVQIFVVEEPHKWATYMRIAVQNYESDSKGKKAATIEAKPISEETKKRDEHSLFDEAKSLVKDHRYKDAEKKFKEALAVKKHGFLYCGLGNLYYKIEKYDEAVKAYKEALKIEPDIPYPKRAIEKIKRKLSKSKKKS